MRTARCVCVQANCSEILSADAGPACPAAALYRTYFLGTQANLLDDGASAGIRVGVHWNTSVGTAKHRVCQVFCVCGAEDTLAAAYDATLLVAAIKARAEQRRVTVYLSGSSGDAIEKVCVAAQFDAV